MNAPVRQAPETSRDRRRRETRARLLESAYQAFSTHGYANASLEAIAADAGFTRGALYANFASREELFLALSAERAELLFAEWSDVRPGDAGTDKLSSALGSWLASALRDRSGWILANAEFSLIAARDPELAARRRITMQTASRELGDLFTRFGVPAPADGAAALGLLAAALIDGVMMYSSVDPDLDVATILTAGLDRLLADQPS